MKKFPFLSRALAVASLAFAVAAFCLAHGPQRAGAASDSASPADLAMVVVMTRHGVRSPTHPNELNAYSARPWPAWKVRPGYLTPHGAALMRGFGAAYGRRYGSLAPAVAGCPARDAVFVWADTDQRTLATGRALLDGFAPKCSSIGVNHAATKTDTLFDPSVGRVDVARSKASLLGSLGGDPNSLTQTYARQYGELNAVLGCVAPATCKPLAGFTTSVASTGDGGLAELSGGFDLAESAVGDMYLGYVEGLPDAGWGRLDARTMLDLLALRSAQSRLVRQNPYTAQAHSSNILTHIAQTLEQGATATKSPEIAVPAGARVVFLVGHDTQLSQLAGLLRLSWLAPQGPFNDAPPGGALVFELHAPAASPAYVRLFFAAQRMTDMRAGIGTRPDFVPVYVPGCPSLDCPLESFAKIVDGVVDASFVQPWR